MRWEDERYVRFYTRDTPEWLALSWQARGLFGLIMRHVDRAGILKVGRLGLKGVAVSVRANWIEIETPLKELLEDGCVRFHENKGVVLLPNFQEAQDVAMSDKLRKQISRENARRDADEDDKVGVTKSDQPSQSVQPGHEPSLLVTPDQPSLAEPSSTEPSLAVPTSKLAEPVCPIPLDWQPRERTTAWTVARGVDAVRAVAGFIDYWQERFEKDGGAPKKTPDEAFKSHVKWLLENKRAPLVRSANGVAKPKPKNGREDPPSPPYHQLAIAPVLPSADEIGPPSADAQEKLQKLLAGPRSRKPGGKARTGVA